MLLLGLKRKTEQNYQPINVLRYERALVPTLEFLVRAQHIPNSLRREAMRFVEEFDSRLPRNEEKVKRFGNKSTGTTLKERKLRGDSRDYGIGEDVLNRSIDAKVENCVIGSEGSVLYNSVRPTVNGSVVISKHAFDGDGNTFYRPAPDNMPYLASPNSAFRSLEQYQTFVKIQEDMLSGNPEGILRTLVEFSKTVTEDQHTKALETLGHDNRYIIPVILDNLYNALPQDRKNVLGRLSEDERLVVAADLVYQALKHMSADTYNIRVCDSVVFAESALNYVKGGTVKDSIIAGKRILEGANITVANSYLITPKGTRFVEGQVFGEPEAFDKVPVCLTDRKTLFERIAPYRDPAIQWFRSVRVPVFAVSNQPK